MKRLRPKENGPRLGAAGAGEGLIGGTPSGEEAAVCVQMGGGTGGPCGWLERCPWVQPRLLRPHLLLASTGPSVARRWPCACAGRTCSRVPPTPGSRPLPAPRALLVCVAVSSCHLTASIPVP